MNRAPKIMYLITKSNFGGAQKYVYELAVAAKERGAEVVVACGGTGEKHAKLGLMAEKLSTEGIRIVPIPHFMRDMSPDADFLAFFEVRRLLKDERPDVLHVTSSKAGAIGALAGRMAHIPTIIFTSHGLTIDEVWRPIWQRALIYIGTWLTIWWSHATIMISKETNDRARHMPLVGRKVHYIKNGVSPVDFYSKEEARHELGLSVIPGQLLIGGIGELHRNKNWHVAIQTIATLPTNASLAIIGSGDEYESLHLHGQKLNVADRVTLLGYVPDAVRYLRAFDIFVLPSKKEGLPYVILEAGLAGLPVVASDLPGIRDIIDSGEQGFLVDPTPKMLSTSLEMLLRDEGMRRRLGAALQERIMNKFSIHTMIDKTFALYSKIPRASK